MIGPALVARGYVYKEKRLAEAGIHLVAHDDDVLVHASTAAE